LQPIPLAALKVDGCANPAMAPSRLTDSQKQELLVRYRAGESSAVLAGVYGCSVNTVSRTVRTLLTPEEYDELKAARFRAANSSPALQSAEVEKSVKESPKETGSGAETSLNIQDTPPDGDGEASTLALEDADDFGDEDPEEVSDDDGFEGSADDVFQEIAVLPVDLPQVSREQVSCRPFVSGVLPDSVYMLVDKSVELDPKPLSEFPELGVLNPEDLTRQALCLYSSPRSAKRQCGRSQRVIKVPNTQVFERTSRHLLARGITRLVLEGALYSLDT
jgi:hypothetical protein